MTDSEFSEVSKVNHVSVIEPVELDNGLFLPASMLLDYGCRNCFFKATDRCPFGLKEQEIHNDGYCEHIVHFLTSLAEPNDTINNIKEKYQLEVQSQQAISDFAEFKEMERELKTRRANGEFGPCVDALEMRTMAYKNWWSRLSESSSKGWQKINDRRIKDKSNDINVTHKLDLSQMHSLMNNAKTKVLANKSDNIIIDNDTE